MTINGGVTENFDAESCDSYCEYDSGHTSPTEDFVYSPEEIQEIYDELDLDEEGITDEEILRRKTRIFVGGLNFESNSCVLDEYFSAFGKIKEAVVIKDRKTEQYNKGYGFVSLYLITFDLPSSLTSKRRQTDIVYRLGYEQSIYLSEYGRHTTLD